MSKVGGLHFYPERIAWIGGGVISAGLFAALIFLSQLSWEQGPILPQKNKALEVKEVQKWNFTLGLSQKGPALPIPSLQDQLSFSFDPPRPVGEVQGGRVLVRLKKSGESKRVILPCRLDLAIKRDQLTLAGERTPFWVDLSLGEDGRIEGRGKISGVGEEELEAGLFITKGQEAPIQLPQEFPDRSPFRILGEAKWWGKDLFREEGGERLEVAGSDLIELREGEWLLWKNERWEKGLAPEMNGPIARIQSIGNKGLVLEGWDEEGHVRIGFSINPGPPFKAKGEDLFSAIRVRSEKQISCMLEKQCMVLKTGDWVLKTGGRWKVLRKKEERDAFLSGKLFGDLFCFEQISQKQGQKVIVGKLFNSGRTQVVHLEMGAHSARKSGERGVKR